MMAAATFDATPQGAPHHYHQDTYFPQVSDPDAVSICLPRSKSFMASKTATSELDQETIPVGFPNSINGPTAWTGTDFKNERNGQSNILHLDAAHVRELEQAYDHFEGVCQEFMRKVTLSLPSSRTLKTALALSNS